MTPESDSEGAEVPEEAPPRRTRAAAIWEQVSTLIVAVVIALGIRTFLIEPFRIPSGSMFPTLLIGDHLFVNKLTYGPRIPFTDIRLPGFREPERGDVVVFEVGRNDGRDSTLRTDIAPADLFPALPRDDFVKRLVGLPGDRIAIHNGRVTINGVPAERASTPEEGVRAVQAQLIAALGSLAAWSLDVLDVMDQIANNIFLLGGGLMLSIFVGWVMEDPVAEASQGASRTIFHDGWRLLLRFVVPVALVFILANSLPETWEKVKGVLGG